MSQHTFHQQYMNEFWDDFLQVALKRLADQYHQETEEYDKQICEVRNERGVAMPTNVGTRLRMSSNARMVHKKLGEKAIALGFSLIDWDRAIQSAADRLR